MTGTTVTITGSLTSCGNRAISIINGKQALHHNFHLSVTIEVTHRAVVGLILQILGIVRAVVGRLQGNRYIR